MKVVTVGSPMTCEMQECDLPPMARGLCNKHYQQLRKEGRLEEFNTKIVHSLSNINAKKKEAFCKGCNEIVSLRWMSVRWYCRNGIRERRKTASESKRRRETLDSWVYCAYTSSGGLLYVGKTNRPTNRMRQHRRKKIWWDQAESIDWLRFKLEIDALAHEALLIAELRPEYNKILY